MTPPRRLRAAGAGRVRSPRRWRRILLAALSPVAVAMVWLLAARLLHPAGDDVLLITVDTLRADHIAPYGGEARTPAMSRLAGSGVLFETAWTNIPRTTPAIASLMTGRYPHHHGVRFLWQPLPDGEPTLAESLTAAGFRSAALVAGGPLDATTRLDRGFSLYRCYTDLKAGLLTLRALPWILAHIHRRTFLWVHYFDPHFGYQPPWPYSRAGGARAPEGFSLYDDLRERRLTFGRLHFAPPLSEEEHAWLRAQYRGEIEYTDAAMRALLAAVRLRDLVTGRSTLVAFTADHGESLGEHGCWYEHGEFLYEPDMLIPFAVSWPGRLEAGRRSELPVELVDLAPTLLGLLALPPLPLADGRDLSGALSGADPEPRALFAESGETFFPENPRRQPDGTESKWTAVRRGGWKLIRIPGEGTEGIELYDLGRDPAETVNRAAEEEPAREALRSLLEAWRTSPAARPQDGPPAMDEETLEKLRALGYLD